MDTLPNELIGEIVNAAPAIYLNMLMTCRRHAAILRPHRDHYADLNVQIEVYGSYTCQYLSIHDTNKYECDCGLELNFGIIYNQCKVKHGVEIIYKNPRIGDKLIELHWRYGKLHGTETWYNDGNKVSSITHWKHGKLHGDDIKYSALTGDIIALCVWDNGVAVYEYNSYYDSQS